MSVLEVCCGNGDSVRAAVQGGASRIELCSRLDVDGLTPAWEELLFARRFYPLLRIHVLIRPREGDFVCSPRDLLKMIAQMDRACALGADGLVLGCLTPEGDVDVDALDDLMPHAGGLPVTFHRAFDQCRNPFQALEDVISMGCSRILTSGQAPTALEGADLIRALQERAAGRIILLPGGGVTPENAAAVLQRTGCREIHASASEPGLYGERVTSAVKVAAILKAIA